MTQLEIPTKIKIMADHGMDAYAWNYENRYGVSPLSDYFPESPEIAALDEEFYQWCRWFERSSDEENFPWESFHEKGVGLASRLAQMVKPFGIEIYYDRPYEDPRGKDSEPFRISL